MQKFLKRYTNHSLAFKLLHAHTAAPDLKFYPNSFCFSNFHYSTKQFHNVGLQIATDDGPLGPKHGV